MLIHPHVLVKYYCMYYVCIMTKIVVPTKTTCGYTQPEGYGPLVTYFQSTLRKSHITIIYAQWHRNHRA